MIKDLLNRASCSLIGHFIIVGAPFAVAETIALTLANYNEGTLNAAWAVHIGLVSVAGGLIVSFLVWYTITRPILRRKSQKCQKH